MIVATALAIVVLVGALFLLRSYRGDLNVDLRAAGCSVADAGDGTPADTVVCWPDADAEPSDYRETARQVCEREGIRLLAAHLNVKPEAEAVARTYMRWVPEFRDTVQLRAVRAGCLRGLRDRR